MEIDIKAEYVELAYHFRKDTPHEKFPGLHGVRVEPHKNGAVIIATDGAWIFVGIDDTGYASEPINLNIRDIVHAHLSDRRSRLAADNDYIRVTTKGALVHEQFTQPLLNQQSYPNWRQVIPAVGTLKPCIPATFGAGYLETLGRVFKDTKRFGDILFLGKDAQSACVMHFTLMPSIMMVAMPLDWVEKNKPKLPDTTWSDRFKSAMPKVTDSGDL